MATKLNVDKGGLDIGKKLWKKHQDNEYTHVDNYKEAICLNCFKKDAAAATIADNNGALYLNTAIPGTSANDQWRIKVDNNGDVVFQKRVGGAFQNKFRIQ